MLSCLEVYEVLDVEKAGEEELFMEKCKFLSEEILLHIKTNSQSKE